MRKFLAILLTVAMIFSFAACAGKTKAPTTDGEKPTEGYEIGLVTDVGTIDDKSFNQGAWEGVVKYAEETGKTYKYYQPTDEAKDTLLSFIDLAIQNGAKIVVCPGFNFETAIYDAQTKYPDVSFILLDGTPHTEDYSTFKTEKNVMPILYKEDQAGFLAGYAAVKDGMTKLGFMGGMAVPAVIRFGYGFVQGADYAAKELDVTGVEINYNYTGQFAATPEAQAMASGWYTAGTQVIFGCGGALGNSVMAAATTAGTKVIGVDVDQSSESDTVITSAMKNLTKSVYDGLTAFYNGSFKGGETTVMDAKAEGIGLPMDTSKFAKFTKTDYDAIYAKLVSGEITLKTDADAESADALGTTVATVNVIA